MKKSVEVQYVSLDLSACRIYQAGCVHDSLLSFSLSPPPGCRIASHPFFSFPTNKVLMGSKLQLQFYRMWSCSGVVKFLFLSHRGGKNWQESHLLMPNINHPCKKKKELLRMKTSVINASHHSKTSTLPSRHIADDNAQGTQSAPRAKKWFWWME